MKFLSVGAELFHADGRTDGRRDGQTGMTLFVILRTCLKMKILKLLILLLIAISPVCMECV
jgi:hypothetical protein